MPPVLTRSQLAKQEAQRREREQKDEREPEELGREPTPPEPMDVGDSDSDAEPSPHPVGPSQPLGIPSTAINPGEERPTGNTLEATSANDADLHSTDAVTGTNQPNDTGLQTTAAVDTEPKDPQTLVGQGLGSVTGQTTKPTPPKAGGKEPARTPEKPGPPRQGQAPPTPLYTALQLQVRDALRIFGKDGPPPKTISWATQQEALVLLWALANATKERRQLTEGAHAHFWDILRRAVGDDAARLEYLHRGRYVQQPIRPRVTSGGKQDTYAPNGWEWVYKRVQRFPRVTDYYESGMVGETSQYEEGPITLNTESPETRALITQTLDFILEKYNRATENLEGFPRLDYPEVQEYLVHDAIARRFKIQYEKPNWDIFKHWVDKATEEGDWMRRDLRQIAETMASWVLAIPIGLINVSVQVSIHVQNGIPGKGLGKAHRTSYIKEGNTTP